MNLYRIGVVATGLLGLWMIAQAVMHFPGLLVLALVNQNVSDGVPDSVDRFLFLLPVTAVILSLVPGYLMIRFRRQIARAWLLADFEPDVPEIRESVIAMLTFALFGLSLIFRAARMYLFALLRLMSRPEPMEFLTHETILALVFVVAGFLMFQFAKPLARRFSDDPRTGSRDPGESQ